MDKLASTTDLLRRLIANGSTNGILLAEKEIDGYLSAVSGPPKSSAIWEMQKVVKAHRDMATGNQKGVAEAVYDYLEKRRRES